MLRTLLAAALLAILAWPSFALDPARPLDLYDVDVWRDGLPQYLVRAVHQTRDGYLWFATMEGLVRFNGLTFEVFDQRNTPALRTSRIRGLHESRDGALWIATAGGGVVRHHEGRFTALTKADGLADDSVVAIAETRDALWFATANGLSRYRDGRFTTHLAGTEITALAAEANGTLWIGSARGLLHDVSLVASDPIDALMIARDGTIWAGARDHVLRIARDRSSQESIAMPVTTAYVHDILEDSRGTIWLATSPGGLLRLRGGRFELLDKTRGLPSSSVRALAEDREGSLWIGTDSGLARLADRKFVTYTTRHGLPEDNVRVVAEAREGGLWIGTYGGGLAHLRDHVVTRLGEPTFVRTLLEDAEGTLWVGTDSGLGKLSDGRMTTLTTKDGLASDKIDALAALRDGTLLVSTPRGVQMLRDGRFETFLVGEAAGPDVRVMLESESGDLWLGTYDGLVQVRDRRIVQRLREGLPSRTIFALHEDARGDLWIGTHDGLARLRAGRMQSITAAHGLPHPTVFQILDDGRGHFWLTSNQGLTRVTRSSLDAVLDGGAQRVQATTFDRGDGLGSDQCNGASQPAGVRMRNGRLAIPTLAGLTIVDPADLHWNRVPPNVVLREVLVDGRPIDTRSAASLPWSASRFEFRYDGLSLAAPELVRFRHRVDGLDRDWIDAGTLRRAFYNSLPPGQHVFRVQAMNSDGVWSREVASLAFTVPAPPWLRWWALVLYAAAAIAVAWLLLRARERAVRRKTEVLEAKVRERTIELAEAEARATEANRAKSVFLANMSHELRTPLNAVLGFAQLMGRSETLAPGERESLSIIRRSGEHLLGLINDVLSISKIEAGKLAVDRRPFDPRRMVDDISAIIHERAEAAGLQLVVDAGTSLPPAVLGDEGKLRQIFINLLGNAVKFTKHGTVTLRARWADDRAVFEVADTGRGIDPMELESLFEPFVQTEAGREAKEGTGLGLAITRQLVRLMGGDIQVFSEVGSGTIFRFDVDLPRTDLAVPQRESRRVLGLAPGEPHRRILVVDDRRENSLLLAKLLTTVGFEVREAANGIEALDLWRQWQPDLIFMDERMPRMDGSETTRILRAEEAEQQKSRTAIVALTASAFEHEREAILASGADDFVVKPHSEDDVFDAIARTLGVVFRKRDVPEGGGNRVLLVDDDRVNLHITRELLVRLGCDVSEAQDGQEALAMLDASAFDAVLLDIEMPGLDGRATVREIRARERFRDLPVIAMTAHDGDVRVEGMTDYLGKPIDGPRLAAVLARHLPRLDRRPV